MSGKPDVIIHGEIEPEAAGDLLNDFNLYNIVEQPNLKDGDTISFTENSPVYQLSYYKDYRYEQEDPFYNPCTIHEKIFKKVVGITSKGKKTKKVRVIRDKFGRIVTSFPI